MSGLQQALMQLNRAQLTAMKKDGTLEERRMAGMLEPLVIRRHLTLVTLLIGNALAMEALPVRFICFFIYYFNKLMLFFY